MPLDPTHPKYAHVDQRLRSEPILWLSSIRPDGRPHLVPVWFLWDGASIFIFSQPGAQKIRNLQANPAVTLALEAADEGADIAIIEGTAAIFAITDWDRILPAYTAKYEQTIREMGWTIETMTADYSKVLQVTPIRMIAW
jgi:PPOX class probable F420-dependent enzyme